MKQLRAGNIASAMMLVWLVFYILAAFAAPKWADFLSIVGCTVPMLGFKHKVRGKTFGTRDCNTVIYKKTEYAAFFVLCICGSALLSALVSLPMQFLNAANASRTDFPYLLVFACFLPAFFEEWLLRGGVLGTLAKHGAAGVWMCGIFFMLMHIDPVKWPYALFAGVLITALVYKTECIYLGMLLHFCNNFASLLLSYLPSGIAEYVALAMIALLLAAAWQVLKQGKLGTDVWGLLREVNREQLKALFTPLFWVFAVAVIILAYMKVTL